MTTLAQVLAVSKGVKGTTEAAVTGTYHNLQRPQLLTGLARTYAPRDEEGDPLPPESTRVQLTVDEALETVRVHLTRLFDVTAAIDWANCDARADLVVEGVPLVKDAPVSYLLFLEKQLVGLRTLVSKIPTLDPAEEWHADEVSGLWRTPPVRTVRSKKVPRNHILAEATDRHPAQVQMYHEDVPAGDWTTVKFSGAAQSTQVRKLLERVEKLQEAVKYAREKANQTEVLRHQTGSAVCGYLFS